MRGCTTAVERGVGQAAAAGSDGDSGRNNNPRIAPGMVVGSEHHYLHGNMDSMSAPTTPLSSYAGAHAGSRRRPLRQHQDGQNPCVNGACGRGGREDSSGQRVRSVSVDSVAAAVAWIIEPYSGGRVDGNPGPIGRERAWSDAADATAVAMAAAVILLDGGAVDEDWPPPPRRASFATGGNGGGGCARRSPRFRSPSNPDNVAVAVAPIATMNARPPPPQAGRGRAASAERSSTYYARAGLGGGGGAGGRPDETTSSTSGSSSSRRPMSSNSSRSSTTSGLAPRPPSPARARPLAHDRGRRSSSVGNLTRRCRSASPFPSAGSGARTNGFGRAGGGCCQSSSSSSSGGGRRQQPGIRRFRSRSLYNYPRGGGIRVADGNGLCAVRQPHSLAAAPASTRGAGGGGDGGGGSDWGALSESSRSAIGLYSSVSIASAANGRDGSGSSTLASSGGGARGDKDEGGVGSTDRHRHRRSGTRGRSRQREGDMVRDVAADNNSSEVCSGSSSDDDDDSESDDGRRTPPAANQRPVEENAAHHHPHHHDLETAEKRASSGSVALEMYEDFLSSSARTRGWKLTGPSGRAVPWEHGAEVCVAAPVSSTTAYYYYNADA